MRRAAETLVSMPCCCWDARISPLGRAHLPLRPGVVGLAHDGRTLHALRAGGRLCTRDYSGAGLNRLLALTLGSRLSSGLGPGTTTT
jgi:hypothetical protein